MTRAEFTDPFQGKEGIFHLSMPHLEKGLLFRSDDDYGYGVNTLAAATLKYPVSVIAYCLMDNHFHLLLKGLLNDAVSFYDWGIRKLAQRMGRLYGTRRLLSVHSLDIQPVTDDSSFINNIAYILRNPYKARICSPYSYPWSSAAVYFSPNLELTHGQSIHTIRGQQFGYQTHIHVPEHWEHDGHRILDKCFVDYKYVENRIRSSLPLFDAIRKYSLESVVAQEHGAETLITYTDHELQEKTAAICRNEYDVISIHQLDRKSLFRLARTLAFRFGATTKQLSRLLAIPQATLDQLL